MRKPHGDCSQNYLNKKVMRNAFIAFLLLLLLVFLFYLIAEPIISRFCLTTTSIHHGIEYYESEIYLEYESGNRFSDILKENIYINEGTITDFYHVDNHLRDNPLYGKMCDVFAVDVQLSSSAYLERQEEVSSNCEYCCSMEDYELYVADFDTGVKHDVVLIALCDRACIVRCILLTDKDPVSLNSSYGTTLIQQSSLDWSGTQDTGDGLREP